MVILPYHLNNVAAQPCEIRKFKVITKQPTPTTAGVCFTRSGET